MFMSRVSLRDEAWTPQSLQRLVQDKYHQHQLLRRLFPGVSHRLVKRTVNGIEKEVKLGPLLYRQDEHNGRLCFYVISEQVPVDESGLWRIEPKRCAPKLSAGQRLSFTLRANPTVAKKPAAPDPNPKKRKRHDIVMEAKKRLNPNEEKPFMLQLIHDAGVAWLSTRSEKHGFTFDPKDIRVDGYRQHSFYKRGIKAPIELSTLDFTGLLEVTDPERFTKLLYDGIGPAKAFGCGLMLVRRAR